MATEDTIKDHAQKAFAVSNFNSRMIEDHPADTLVRVKSLIALYQSVDWDSPMMGADNGAVVLFDEVLAALEYVISQIAEVQQKHFIEPFEQPLDD